MELGTNKFIPHYSKLYALAACGTTPIDYTKVEKINLNAIISMTGDYSVEGIEIERGLKIFNEQVIDQELIYCVAGEWVTYEVLFCDDESTKEGYEKCLEYFEEKGNRKFFIGGSEILVGTFVSYMENNELFNVQCCVSDHNVNEGSNSGEINCPNLVRRLKNDNNLMIERTNFIKKPDEIETFLYSYFLPLPSSIYPTPYIKYVCSVGYKKFAMVVDDDDILCNTYNAWIDTCNSCGNGVITNVLHYNSENETDDPIKKMEIFLESITDNTFEYVLLSCGNSDIEVDIMKVIANGRINFGGIYFSKAVETGQVIDELKEKSNYLVGPTEWHYTVRYPGDLVFESGSVEFNTLYFQKYGEEATGIAAAAAAAGVIYVTAFNGLCSIDNTYIIELALSGIHVNSFFGPIMFDYSNQGSGRDMIIVQIFEGKVSTVLPEDSYESSKIQFPIPTWDAREGCSKGYHLSDDKLICIKNDGRTWKLEVGLIVGIGGIFIILLCIGLVWIFMKRYKAQQEAMKYEEAVEKIKRKNEWVECGSELWNEIVKEIREIEGWFPRSRFFVMEKLGSGEFGIVSKALVVYKHRAFICVVKQMICEGKSEEENIIGVENFLNEARMMKNLIHPNVIMLLGVSCVGIEGVLSVNGSNEVGGEKIICCNNNNNKKKKEGHGNYYFSEKSNNEYYYYSDIEKFIPNDEPQSVFLLIEMMEIGSMKEYLCRRKQMHQIPTLSELLWFCYQISSGLRYLAENNIVHCDLAARNILLSHPSDTSHGFPICKIGDLGLAKNVDEVSGEVRTSKSIREKSNTPLPVRWMALESLRERGFFSLKTDVWSLGVVMWEIFSLGALPYEFANNSELIVIQTKAQILLRKPMICPDNIFKSIEKCWIRDWNQRPSAKEFEEMFKFYFENDNSNNVGCMIECDNGGGGCEEGLIVIGGGNLTMVGNEEEEKNELEMFNEGGNNLNEEYNSIFSEEGAYYSRVRYSISTDCMMEKYT